MTTPSPQQHVSIQGRSGAPAVPAEGTVAHDAVDTGNPLGIGGNAQSDISSVTSVAIGDRARLVTNIKGVLAISGAVTFSTDGDASGFVHIPSETGTERPLATGLMAVGPDGNNDRLRTAHDSAPGLGALNVAPIGGDITLRGSAIIGEASGTSTAVDNLGWVKSFNAHLDVTAVPSGGSPTLNVYIQTQLASGDWQDIVSFTQVAGATTAQIVSWVAPGPNMGTQAEGAAVVVDNFFAEQTAALTATTIRKMPLGDSMRCQWVFAAGGSTGDYTFALTGTFHS